MYPGGVFFLSSIQFSRKVVFLEETLKDLQPAFPQKIFPVNKSYKYLYL